MESVFYKYLSLQNDSIQFARQKPSLWLFWGILDDFCGFFGKKFVFRGMFRYNSQQMNLFTEGVGLMENKYESLRETLRQRAKREFAPGAKFPTQRALMAEYGVSLATVDRALRELDRVCRTGGRIVIPTYMNRTGKGTTNGVSNMIGKAGADFKREFTLDSYRQFFADAGYADVRYTLCEGTIPCAVAVIRKGGGDEG